MFFRKKDRRDENDEAIHRLESNINQIGASLNAVRKEL